MTTTVQELAAATRYRRLGGWRAEAWQRLDDLARDIDLLGQVPDDPARPPDRRARIQALAAELKTIGTELNQTGPDEVWAALHGVEEGAARLSQGDQLLEYAEWAAQHLSDPALKGDETVAAGEVWKRLEATRERSPGVADPARDVATIMHRAHCVIDRKHRESNDYSARLRVAAIALLVLSGLIILTAALVPQLPFLVAAEKFPGVNTFQLALLVALGGLVGGSWGAFPTFTNSKRDTYRVQYARAGARLAMGVLAALLGVSLVGAGWVDDLSGSTAPALFAVSVAFGLAQEPVTRALEGKLANKEGDASGDAKD